MDYPNDRNVPFSLDEEHSVGKTPRQSTPNHALVDNGIKLRIPLDGRHHSTHAQKEFRTQSGDLFLVPLICLSQVGFRFRSDDQWLVHDLDRSRIRF